MSDGVSLSGAHECQLTLRRAGVTTEFWERVAKDVVLARKVVALVFNHSEDFRVPVDYGKTFAEKITAGNYDWVDPNINAEIFPVKGTGVTDADVVLFHFGKDVTTVWIEREMSCLATGRPGLRSCWPSALPSPCCRRRAPSLHLALLRSRC